MKEKLRQFWNIFKGIIKDKCGEGDMETVAKILFTPCGYKFLKNNIEKYAAQLGMLNHLLKKGLITEKEHSTIKQNLKRRYEIK
ncbi:MAG: SHOCT domain-containing protein [Sedimentibacter sp.]